MLPAYPWAQRPDDHPLTAEEACAALVEASGDITQAAQRLHIGSLTLRKFIERSPRARAVVLEMDMRLADRARSKLAEALNSGDDRRQDWAIRYILNSKNARSLGWAAADAPSDQANPRNAPLVSLVLPPAEWLSGEKIGPRQAAKAILELAPAPPNDVD